MFLPRKIQTEVFRCWQHFLHRLTILQNMEDSQVMIDGRLIDIADNAWREEKLPNDFIDVPPSELPDPDADNGDSHMTVKEQEQKWADLSLNVLSEQHYNASN